MLSLPVYDLSESKWLSDYHNVVYRNTLLGTLYKNSNFAIGDCYALLKAGIPHEKIADILDTGFDNYTLVGASGSRKYARVIYSSSHKDAFSRFFGSNANCINYGGNLTTECKKIERIKVNLLVVQDGEWGTGDCHGKCNLVFAIRFANNPALAMQHRTVCESDNWIAKGTIIYSEEVRNSKYDLILPVSSFKGNKVKPGNYKIEVVVGIVFTSPEKNEDYEQDWRTANLSYSVVQFLPWDAVEKDILPRAKKKAEYLNKVAASPVGVLNFLKYLNENGEVKTDDEEYTSSLVKVLKADIYSQLATHPWVVNKVAELMQKQWVKLATCGGVKFNYSMIMPDDNLPDDTVMIPSLPLGVEVIVFPYPCRWKHDIKVLPNVYRKQWDSYQGIIVMNTKTALKLSRDFDGDSLYWYLASNLPNIADAVRQFPDPPAEQAKPPKNVLQGTLGEIALMSMDNLTGLITWLIAKANAVGRADIVYQMVPQLQAAVDSLKGATPPNTKLIDDVGNKLLKFPVSWLKEHKNPDLFIKHPFSVSNRMDTISQLANAVSALWIPNKNKTSNVTAFLPLFDKPSEQYIQRAVARCKEYSSAINEALKPKMQYIVAKKPVPLSVEDKVDEEVSKIVASFKELLANCKPEQRIKAVAAFWWVRHWFNKSESSTNIAFIVGIDEICLQLCKLRIKEIELLNKNNPLYACEDWQGEAVIFQLIEKNGYVHAYDSEGDCVGALALSQYPPVMIGEWCRGKLYTKYSGAKKPCAIRVIVEEAEF